MSITAAERCCGNNRKKTEDEKMFCFKCGSEIIEVGNFCKVCGAPVVVASEPNAKQTAQSIPIAAQPYPPPVADSSPAAPAPWVPQDEAPPSSAQLPQTPQPAAASPEIASSNAAPSYAAPQYAPPQYASQNTPPPKPKKGKSATLPIVIAAVVGVVIIAVALFFIIGMLSNSDADTDTIETPPGSVDEIQNNEEDVLNEESDALDETEETDEAEETEDTGIPEDSEDENNGSLQWLSYEMSIEIIEEDPNGSDITPTGRFVHVIITYLSDDDDLGGFLLEDLIGKADFIMTDASGNAYEHVGIISPISLDFDPQAGLSADEIQPVSGVYFDIPLDVQLNELIFSVGN